MRFFFLTCLAWMSLQAEVAAARGLELTALPPADAGKVEVQVDVSASFLEGRGDTPLRPEDFRAIVGTGAARITGLRPFDAAEQSHTTLAFDHSGSFRHHWRDSMLLARALVDALPDDGMHPMRFLTFGLRMDEHGGAERKAEAREILDRLAGQPPRQVATRLKSSIRDALLVSARALPLADKGHRQLVVFTDAGEESDQYDAKALAAEARELGVRIHVVGLYRKDRMRDALAERMDEMKLLAETSGGRYVQVDELEAAAAQVAALARSFEGLHWLELAFCGLPSSPTHFQEQLQIELMRGGQRVAWSPRLAFRQHASEGALRDCPCSPPCAGGERCVAGGCVPAVATPASLPPTGAADGDPPRGGPPWGWLLLLLGVLAAAVLLIRQGLNAKAKPAAPPPGPPQPEPPTPEPEAPAPEPFQAPPAPAWQNPLAVLPETRLVLLRGPASLQRSLRLVKEELSVGSAAGEVDLLIDLPQISGKHATFQLYRSGNVFVRDENSTNGTIVNGRRLARGERVLLQPGAIIGLSAHVELRLEQGRRDAPQEGTGAAAPGTTAADPTAPPARGKARTIYAPVKRKAE